MKYGTVLEMVFLHGDEQLLVLLIREEVGTKEPRWGKFHAIYHTVKKF
jgi:hypothetical protein